MLGKRPYSGRTRKDIREQILTKQARIRKKDVPYDWSLDGADFINKMIQRKPTNRLGLNGPEEVKEHPWFKGFEWEELESKRMPTPFKPNMTEDNFD